MEDEKFISGYCRALDSSRTVCALITDGALTEVDCAYGSCPYQADCPIGKELANL